MNSTPGGVFSTPGSVFYAKFVVGTRLPLGGGPAFMEIEAKNSDVDYNIVNNYCTLH